MAEKMSLGRLNSTHEKNMERNACFLRSMLLNISIYCRLNMHDCKYSKG